MKKAVFFLLFFFFFINITAQESQTDYNFLRLPVSAHAAALGGDNISIIEDDPTLMFNNPALISSVSDKTMNLNYMTYMEGVTLASASFTKVINDKATWAASAQYIDYGNIKEVTADNVEVGTFSARYKSLAMGVDLGLNYYDEDRDVSASVVAKNLGGQLKAYNDTYEAIPLDLQIGASKRLSDGPLRISGTLVDRSE